MFSKLALVFGILVTVAAAAPPPVYTQEIVFHSLIEEPPSIVDATRTTTWTASPSITFTRPPLPVSSKA
ncbi:hypothetical protein AN958_10576 [Leucoagaricus sp. SymC.cos]|nr:hypothetical protein AN958_10576 [Leucoagaricus sp. SymC.cos]